ncbi:MAG TPA: LPS export ABC transporter permease LptG [Rhizomicrobium sp.]|nr:LPS export ABC transporter permease LptG [Rhizomicrobium sp.]
MTWSWTLYRYLGLQFLVGVGIVYGVFLLLAYSIDLVDLLGRTAGQGVSTSIVIGMGLLQLPDIAQKLMPFAVLLGGVFTFVRLSRTQELVATRAAGVSAWDFLAPPLAVAVLLGITSVLVLTPVTARLLSEFAVLEEKYIHNDASQLAVSENGLWLRQGDEHGQSVIHALHVTNQGVKLDEVIVFLYGIGDTFRGRIDASKAQLMHGRWLLQDAWVSGPEGRPIHHATYNLPTTLTPTRIQESFASPDTLSFWALPGFIRAAQKAGFAATRYELYLYTLLALPALFAAMVFMGASFSLRLARFGGIPRVIVFSALAGFGVYFFADLTQALGQSGILPVALAASAPAVAAILFGMTLVFHQEDG